MANTLDDTLKAVQDIVGRVEGIRSSPEYATDKVPPGVWSMVYPADGVYSQGPVGVLKGLHNIGLMVVTPRVDLAKTLAKIIPLGDKVAAALESEPTLLDTADTFDSIAYTFNFAINVGTDAAPAYVTGWSFSITGVKVENDSAITT